MRIIGFNLNKISAERLSEKISKKPSTSIEFTDLKEEDSELLKDGKIIKISFRYFVLYGENESNKDGTLTLEGEIMLSVSKEESKDLTKDWKKKKLPASMNIILFNFILRRCTPKAIFLEDEIGLPIHTPMPKIQQKDN